MSENTQFIWIAGALIACLCLVQLMRRRQAHLTDLLREYVQAQLAWAKKRAKAARLARAAARERAREEAAAADLLSDNHFAAPEPPAMSESIAPAREMPLASERQSA